MKIKILLSLASIAFLYGCSDENKEVRGEFLAGCIQGGATKSICSCIFKKIEGKYTPDELKKLNSPMNAPPESFLRDIMNSALSCRNE
jgi:hypothetical protein